MVLMKSSSLLNISKNGVARAVVGAKQTKVARLKFLERVCRNYFWFPNFICLGPDSGRSIPLSPEGIVVIFPPAARNN